MKHYAAPLLLSVLLSNAAGVVINEFQAANQSTHADAQGDFDDWVELFNEGAESVDVSGWHLTDDPALLTQWQLPPGSIIPPGGFLLIWADNEPLEGLLHATFKLDAGGESLILTGDDGLTIMDQVEFGGQTTDLSTGRFPDGSGGFFLMGQPTPAASNTSGFLGSVAAPKFTPEHGFYQDASSIQVTLTAPTPLSLIYYTTDGSDPSPANGTLYTGPISVTGDRIIRAVAYRAGWRPSPNVSQTYLLNESASRRSLPAIALGGDADAIFGLEGLYADVLARGRAVEFPVSVEIFSDARSGRVHENAGIRLHGSSWRRRNIGQNPSAKWSFKLFFREDYPGGSDWLDYDFVPSSPVDRYRSVVLRSGYNDPSNPFIKDELGRRLFRDLGQLSSEGGFVNLFVNRQLKNNGYYNPVERLDEKLFQEKYGSERQWDVVNKWQDNGSAIDPPRSHDSPYKFEIRDGDELAFDAMLDFALAEDLSVAANYDAMAQRIDLVNLVDYLIIQGYSRIRDWPHNNWSAARERSPGPLGRWRFYAWDLEFGWGSSELNDTFKVPGSTTDVPLDILYTQLRANPRFRQLFTDRTQKHFFQNGALMESNVVHRFEELRQAIIGVLPNMNTYIRDTWAGGRPPVVIASLVSRGLFTFPGPDLLVNGSPSLGGRVSPGSVLTMTSAEPGATFYYSTDGSDPTNTLFPGVLSLMESVHVKTRAWNGSAWSGLVGISFLVEAAARPGNLAVTELNYHPAPPDVGERGIDPEFTDTDFEFLELGNIGTDPVDLPGLRFAEGIDFRFPEDGIQSLSPGEHVVLVKNREAFALRYGSSPRVAGVYRGKLSKEGERLQLLNREGDVVLDFSYDDRWHRASDGHGFSLERSEEVSGAGEPGRASYWRLSGDPHGSPGEPGQAAPAINPVIVNELLANPVPPAFDAVELHNPNPNPVDVSGWWLTDNFRMPDKHRIADGTVMPAGGFLVLDETDFNAPAGDPSSFSFSSRGEEVYLFSANPDGSLSGYVHGFRFGASERGQTLGRRVNSLGDEELRAMAQSTLGQTNGATVMPSVIVREIMYHPPRLTIGSSQTDNLVEEYVELENRSVAAVDLFDPVRPTNTWSLHGAVEFTFPENRTLLPGQRLLVVGFDPARDTHLLVAFRNRYNLDASTPVLGPYDGKLNNAGETLRLCRPGIPDPVTQAVPAIPVDWVPYRDDAPWPSGADGLGYSLQRTHDLLDGSDPGAWEAARPTPGADAPSGSPPVITSQPSSQSVLIGSSIEFTVASSGPGPFQYQWRFNGESLPGASGPVLTLSAVDAGQAGRYQVVVMTPDFAVASETVRLELKSGMRLLRQPESVIATPGTNVVFSVLVDSPVPVTYQWQHNGQDLSGETNALLSLMAVGIEDGGTYSVVVTSSEGTLVSTAADLVLWIHPEVIIPPVSQSVVQGGTVTFSVVTRGTLPMSYRWRRSFFTLDVVHAFDNTNFFVLTNVQPEDAGSYTVVLTNAVFSTPGVLSPAAILTVLPDGDGDGMPDEWETLHQLDPADGTDAMLDGDGDGVSHLEEYLSGTDPGDALSYLRIEAAKEAGGVRLQFVAQSHRTYTVESSSGISPAIWERLTDVAAGSTNRQVILHESAGMGTRYYRLRTPRRP